MFFLGSILWFYYVGNSNPVLAKPGLKIIISEPVQECVDFDNDLAIFDFTELEFEQTSDNDYAMNGNIKIRETVDGPISIKIETKKLERGEWVSTYFNQFFPDICEEMAKEDPQKWVELFKMLTPNGLCPFVETLYPFEDYRFESDSKATKMIPPTLYGEYMSEFRIQVIGEDDTIKDISCAIAKFELARHD